MVTAKYLLQIYCRKSTDGNPAATFSKAVLDRGQRQVYKHTRTCWSTRILRNTITNGKGCLQLHAIPGCMRRMKASLPTGKQKKKWTRTEYMGNTLWRINIYDRSDHYNIMLIKLLIWSIHRVISLMKGLGFWQIAHGIVCLSLIWMNYSTAVIELWKDYTRACWSPFILFMQPGIACSCKQPLSFHNLARIRFDTPNHTDWFDK